MKRLFIFSLAVAILAPSAFADDKPTGDAAKFQGAWTGMGGPSKDVPFTITFAGAKATLSLERNGQDYKFEGEFKLDEKADPKRVDWVKFTNLEGGAVADNLGIYKFDGAKLVICSGGPGNDRPSDFKAGDEGQPSLSVLTKVDDKPKADAPKGDLAKFQGKWKTKLGEMEINLEIKDKKVVAAFTNDEGKEVKLEGEMVVNDAASPKTIDFVKFHGENGNDMQDNLGIYRIDDDKISICLGGPGNGRPSEFKSGDGGQPTLLTLEKVK